MEVVTATIDQLTRHLKGTEARARFVDQLYIKSNNQQQLRRFYHWWIAVLKQTIRFLRNPWHTNRTKWISFVRSSLNRFTAYQRLLRKNPIYSPDFLRRDYYAFFDFNEYLTWLSQDA